MAGTTPPWRKTAGSAAVWLASLLGAAVALIYEVLMCTAPAPDWSQMRLRTFIGAYVAAPIVILVAAFWLGDWIGGRIDRDRRQN